MIDDDMEDRIVSYFQKHFSMYSIFHNSKQQKNEMNSYKASNKKQLEEYFKLAKDCGFKLKEDNNKLISDSINIIFDTINNQIYIISSLGQFFESIAITIDESLTKITFVEK